MRINAFVARLLAAALAAGAVGPTGGMVFASASDTGVKATQVTGYEIVKVHDAASTDRTVLCPRGKRALSGGAQFTDPYAGFGLIVLSVPAGTRRSGWRTALGNSFSGVGLPPNGTDFYAVCASV